MAPSESAAPAQEAVLPCGRPLRVAVVTETYPPEVNGVAATIARVVDGLIERGHSIQLVRPRQGSADTPRDEARLSELLVRGLPIPRYAELKMGLPATRRLVEAWTRQRPDVVHLVTEGPLGWSALRAATRLGLPVVSEFRTNFHAYSAHYGIVWLKPLIAAYLRAFHNRTACTMVPTEALRSDLAAAGFERLQVVARGVDTALFDPARRSEGLRSSWGAEPDSLVALYVGRLAPEKNLDALMAAASALREADPRVRLVVVGEGPEKERLMQQCAHAVFAGLRRGTDLATHYASADLFLFPSLTETFGNVVTEAMAAGLAVVAHDHAAAGQLIRHGENGLLTRHPQTDDFCRVARSLAGEPAQARALGAQARTTACRLGWGRILEAVERQYAAALPQPGVTSGMPVAATLPV